MTTKKTKPVRSNPIADKLNSLPIMAEVVRFNTKARDGRDRTHKEVIDSLNKSGFDPKIAKDVSPGNAFNRASKKLEQEGAIDIIREDDDDIVFQFSKKHFDSSKEEWKYAAHTKLKLDKTTGAVTCPDRQLQKMAQELVNRNMEMRTTSDISIIAKKLFELKADELIPWGENGGVYLVLKEHRHFLDPIETFLDNLSGKLNRLGIPTGERRNEQEVQEAVQSAMQSRIQSLKDEIAGFTISTRRDTIESKAERIKNLRLQLKGYALYLKEQGTELEKHTQALDGELADKIKELSKQRAELPPEERSQSRPGISWEIERMLRAANASHPASKENILKELVKMFPERDPEKMRKTVNGQLLYNLKVAKGITVSRNDKGFWIEPEDKE